MTISEGRVNLRHTISQRNAQAIQDLLVGIYKSNKHVEGSVDENEGRL